MEHGKTHRIVLQPTQVELTGPAGSPLRDLLFEQGVEFPCGGRGRCRGCRVRVQAGGVEINDAQRERLSEEELRSGWRLACQCSLAGDLAVTLMTEGRGFSNAKAKTELGWQPSYPSWRQGFKEALA